MPRVLAAIIFALFVWGVHRITHELGAPGASDLKRFWAAGGVFLGGGNPYNGQEVNHFSVSSGGGTIGNLPFYYPSIVLSFLAIPSFFPFELFRGVFLMGIGVIYGYTWFRNLSWRWHDNGSEAESAVDRGIILGCYLLFLPIYLMWWVGAITTIPFLALITFFLLSSIQGNLAKVTSGASVALLLVKPSVAPLVVPFLVSSWVRQQGWWNIGGFFAMCVVMILPVWTLSPNFLEIFLPSSLEDAVNWLTPSLARNLQILLSLPIQFRFVPLGCAILFTVISGWKVKPENIHLQLCRVIIPLGAVVTPFVWTYDFVPLLFCLSHILQGTPLPIQSNDCKSLSRPLGLGLLCTNILLWISPLAMDLHWWYPLMFCAASLYSLTSSKSLRLHQPG